MVLAYFSMFVDAAATILSSWPSYAGAAKLSNKAKRAEELDVDDFLNGGFMAVDADKEQDSDVADSSNDEAGAAAADSDDEQDTYDATSAAANDASDSDGARRLAWYRSHQQQYSQWLVHYPCTTKATCHDIHAT